MLEITETEVNGFKSAIRGMRNAMNSWGKSDSGLCLFEVGSSGECEHCTSKGYHFCIGENDHELMIKLAKAGSDHAKYRRFINVTMDIVAPLYWWKEFDTYKVGTVSNSCSTMHKIHSKEFQLEDFSIENIVSESTKNIVSDIVEELNYLRDKYNNTSNKVYWYQMIQLLPSSYNQKRTISLNYEVLANIYKSRRNHKLDEWHTFCDWIEELLPYSEIITLKEQS